MYYCINIAINFIRKTKILTFSIVTIIYIINLRGKIKSYASRDLYKNIIQEKKQDSISYQCCEVLHQHINRRVSILKWMI